MTGHLFEMLPSLQVEKPARKPRDRELEKSVLPASGIRVVRGRTLKLCRLLLDWHDQAKPPFEHLDIPEVIPPKGVGENSLERALHIFFAVQYDGGRPSSVVYAGMRSLFQEHTATDVFGKDKKAFWELLETYMGREGIGRPIAMLWRNIEQLREVGDPRELFTTTKPNEIIDVARGLDGYSWGKAALLVKNYVKLGWIDVDNPHALPIKVDRHATRIFHGYGAIVTEPPGVYRRENLEKVIRLEIQRVTARHGLDPALLDDLLWVLGNQYCNENKIDFCNTQCSLDCSNRADISGGAWYVTNADVRKPATKLDLFD